MSFFCYIIYSKLLNHYYVGYTSEFNERLKLHNTGNFGKKSFTHKAKDWEIFLMIPCETIEQAVFIESRIKKMKSRKYIENLKKYPEVVDKILSEFNML